MTKNQLCQSPLLPQTVPAGGMASLGSGREQELLSKLRLPSLGESGRPTGLTTASCVLLGRGHRRLPVSTPSAASDNWVKLGRTGQRLSAKCDLPFKCFADTLNSAKPAD